MLCAENRKEMEDWISSLKSVQTRDPYEVKQHLSCDLFLASVLAKAKATYVKKKKKSICVDSVSSLFKPDIESFFIRKVF